MFMKSKCAPGVGNVGSISMHCDKKGWEKNEGQETTIILLSVLASVVPDSGRPSHPNAICLCSDCVMHYLFVLRTS